MIVSGLRYAWPDGPEVLQGIDLEIPAGAFIGVMGSNGSGKSTLALCLKGLLEPTGGVIKWDTPPPRADVGLVFQNPDNQLVTMLVERELAFGLENRRLPLPDMRRCVARTLERFGLEPLRGRAPHLLSGGERQKVACASVLITEPRLLILDEATSYLDPQERRNFMRMVAEERAAGRSRGMRLMVITQHAEEVASADRLYVMHEGRIVMSGAPDAVFRRRTELESLGVGAPIAYACTGEE